MNIEKELSAVSQFEFSRWIDFDANHPVTPHVFTDANKPVIGSVAYLSQQGKCVLLGSKSKLDPRGKKTLTIPQLELSAMLVGCQLCASLLATVRKDFPTVSVRLWTDSEIALHWLSSPLKLKQFVQNKVDAINRLFESSFGVIPLQPRTLPISSLVVAVHSRYSSPHYGSTGHLGFIM